MDTPSKSIESDLTPIFICYRQDDGDPPAGQVHQLLHGKACKDGSVLDAYFDVAAPAVDDWTRVHLPYLKRSHAMIVVVSPGAYAVRPGLDWVHEEINWWLANRESCPIIVDATQTDGKWVPSQLTERWENSQRVNIELDENKSLVNPDRVFGVIHDGIKQSESKYLFQELREQKRIQRRLKALSRIAMVAAAVAILVLGYSAFSQYKMTQFLTDSQDKLTELKSNTDQQLTDLSSKTKEELATLRDDSKKHLEELELLSALSFRNMPNRYSTEDINSLDVDLKTLSVELTKLAGSGTGDSGNLLGNMSRTILQASVIRLEAEKLWAKGDVEDSLKKIEEWEKATAAALAAQWKLTSVNDFGAVFAAIYGAQPIHSQFVRNRLRNYSAKHKN